MIRRHPRKAALDRWLSGDAPELSEHLDTCERCATRLEEMSTETPSIRQALIDLLTPPEDLGSTVRMRFDERSRNRADLSLIGDLLALPVHVSRSMSADAASTPTTPTEQENQDA